MLCPVNNLECFVETAEECPLENQAQNCPLGDGGDPPAGPGEDPEIPPPGGPG